MKRPTLNSGIVAAVVITAIVIVSRSMALVFFVPWFALTIAISALICAYGTVIIQAAPTQVGRGLALLFLIVGQGTMIMLGFPAFLVAFFGAGQLWAIRSLLYFRSIIAWGLDGALIAAGAICALLAGQTGLGLVGMAWVFLLSQALFVLIPSKFSSTNKEAPQTSERFERAFKAAESVLR